MDKEQDMGSGGGKAAGKAKCDRHIVFFRRRRDLYNQAAAQLEPPANCGSSPSLSRCPGIGAFLLGSPGQKVEVSAEDRWDARLR